MSEPLAAVDIISVNVSGAEIREVAKLRWKRALHFHDVVGVRQTDGVLDALRVETPQLQRVVHSTLKS